MFGTWMKWLQHDDDLVETDIDSMLAKTRKWEGGWSNHEEDPGGPTMRGITLKTFREYHRNQALTEKDLVKISKADADEILLKEYFYRPKIDKLDGRLAPAVFDAAVNMGPNTAIRLLQTAINEMSKFHKNIKVDGILGKNTLKACNAWDPAALNNEFCKVRWDRYLFLIERNYALKEFKAGWKRRTFDFELEEGK